jgi:preprotein translocase subunit SecA
MRALERYLLLQIIDQRWREHLYDMDYLREGIHLRGFAQIEPLVAYKNEAYTLFRDLMNTVWADFARMIYNVEVEVEGENGSGVPEGQAGNGAAALQYSGGSLEDQPSAYGGDVGAYGVDADDPQVPAPAVVQQRRVDEAEQIGRNDPCWCGSGKKYKKCHGA